MPKRKHKRTHHRRHRVGGMGKTVETLLGTVAGAAAGAFLNNMLAGMTATSTSKIVKALPAAGITALGAFLVPKFIKSDLGRAAGAGMAAAGGLFFVNQALIKLPGLAGVGAPVFRSTRKIQATVGLGAPGFVDTAVNGVMDPAVVGTVYEN